MMSIMITMISVAASLPILVAGQNSMFLNCNITKYYSLIGSPTSASKSEMRDLIKDTHRNTVPYTSDDPDLWDALIDVDGYDSDGAKKIRLIYTDTETAAEPYDQGNCQYWNREHL
jgi:hypothetical protein